MSILEQRITKNKELFDEQGWTIVEIYTNQLDILWLTYLEYQEILTDEYN